MVKPANKSNVALLASIRICLSIASLWPAAAPEPFLKRLIVLGEPDEERRSRNPSSMLFGSLSCIVFFCAAVVPPMTMFTVLLSAGSAPELTQRAAKAPPAMLPGSFMVLPKKVASSIELPWRAST